MAAVNRLGFMGGRRGRETTRTREDLFVALSSHTRTHTHTHTCFINCWQNAAKPKKNRHSQLSSVQDISFWIFVVHALKSYLWARNFSFRGLTPKIYGNIFQTPKIHILAQNDAFWVLVGPDLTRRVYVSRSAFQLRRLARLWADIGAFFWTPLCPWSSCCELICGQMSSIPCGSTTRPE